MIHLPARLRVSALASAVSAAFRGVHASGHRPLLSRNTSRALLVPALFATLAGIAHAAPVSWVFDADGNWANTANWSSLLLPVAADDVTINVGGAAVRTITFNSGSSGIKSLTSAENMIFSGGSLSVSGGFSNTAATTVSGATLTLNGVSSLSTLTQSSGVLNGTGTVTISGASIWTAGTMTGAGSTTMQGALSVSGAGVKDLTGGRLLKTEGATTWTNTGVANGRIRTGGGAVITNTGTWADQLAFDSAISPDFGGASSTFNNIGSYTKSGAATSEMAVAFVNGNATPGSGVVNLNSGTLQLSGGGSNAGTFNVADGTTLAFSAGNFSLGGTVDSGATGRVLVSGATVGTVSAKSLAGLLELSSGTLNVNADANAARYLQSGGTLGGTGKLTVSGSAVWTAGTMTGAGSSTMQGALSLSGAGVKDLTGGRLLKTEGTTTWTNTGAANGRIRTGGGAVITNTGTWADQLAFDSAISPDFGGTATFANQGVYNKGGAGTTTIDIGFNNPATGTVIVSAGTLTLAGGFSNFSGSTLTGGAVNVVGPATFRFTGANVVTNASSITLDGAGSNFLNASNSANGLANFATNAAPGSFTIQNGRNFTTVGAFGNAGHVNVGNVSTFITTGAFTNQATATLAMAGGTLAATSLANAGLLSGFGTLLPVVQNTSLVRASGGMLLASNGVQGATGNIGIDSGSTLDLSAAATGSTAFGLSSAGNLNLGAQNLNVFKDYTNTNSGTGNAFNARAGVTGAGQITGNNTSQTLAGQVTAGAANTFTLDFGNVRGGTSSTLLYQIANNGTGADIRGALQNGAPGLGSISDGRLSGNGITASNFGPIIAGSNSGDLGVTLSAGSLGGSLSGQSVAVVSNFGNVATQTLNLTGFTTVLAQGTAAPAGPIDLGNFRIGGAPSSIGTELSTSNTTTGAGAERLAIVSANTSGNFAAVNNLAGGFVLAGDTSPAALSINTSGGVAGLNTGSVTIQFGSNGQLFDAGFATQATNQQTVDLSARGYRLATASAVTPSPVVFANQRVGGTLTQALSFTNTAAADGFSEGLNATIAASNSATTGGAFNLLGAGASSNALFVGVDTSSAGAKRGTATISLASDGTGSSGFAALNIAGQQVQVSGDVYRLANPLLNTPSATLFARVNDVAPSATISVSNVSPDFFTEQLKADFTSTPTGFSPLGSLTGLTAGASSNALGVQLNTGTAGSFSGSATLAFTSSGSGTTGAPDVSVGTAPVSLSGRVYTTAALQVNTPTVNFGIVHKGDTVTARNVSVTNAAPTSALNDQLIGSLGGASGPFTASGTLAGVAAQASDSGSLTVSIDTAHAGQFNSTATLSAASHNPDMADLALAPASVSVLAQVNNFAEISLQKTAGDGTFSQAGNIFTLDFGTLVIGSTGKQSSLSVLNTASGFADLLRGSFAIGGVASPSSQLSTLSLKSRGLT